MLDHPSLANEAARLAAYPVARRKIFLAHAAVTALPRCVVEAMNDYTTRCGEEMQEFGGVLRHIAETREAAGRLIGASGDEVALLGPTSLGLSLFANGLDWKAGDEVLCYADDYPANVYPWLALRRLGVVVRYIGAPGLGEISPEVVEAHLTKRTRLVALASANFVGGARIDIDGIGALLRGRGVLFSLDAIQTLGAFPTRVGAVDFLSADAHKWLLGPLAIGVVFVRRERFAELRPTLLGAWNVLSPNFIAQDEIVFPDHARRYEPGVLNVAGVYGMRAAIDLVNEIGVEQIAARLLELKAHLVAGLRGMGFEVVAPAEGPGASGITTCRHPRVPSEGLFDALGKADVVASHRLDRAGVGYLRFSPHFYNTEAEIDVALEVLRRSL